MRMIGAMALAISLSACSASQTNKDSQGASRGYEANLETGLSLTDSNHNETAYVKKAKIQCDDYSKVMTFTESEQSAVIFHDLRDCDIWLLEFVVENDEHVLTYKQSNRTIEGFVAYDAKKNGQIVDTKTAMGMTELVYECADSDCRFQKIIAHFTYSTLKTEQLTIENGVAVTELELKIDKELPPWCNVWAGFEQEAWDAPEFVVTLSGCGDLFDNDSVEFALINRDETTDLSFETLHSLISASGDDFIGSNGHEIRLTVEELKALAGTTSLIEALSQDFALAIRNTDGKSIKLYELENECEIVGKDDDTTGGDSGDDDDDDSDDDDDDSDDDDDDSDDDDDDED